jgi:hypothetical protein
MREALGVTLCAKRSNPFDVAELCEQRSRARRAHGTPSRQATLTTSTAVERLPASLAIDARANASAAQIARCVSSDFIGYYSQGRLR